ncbi:MAG: hypothetical protein RR696_14830, partial [Clostridia bacterium]
MLKLQLRTLVSLLRSQFFGLYQNTGRKLQQQTPPTAMRYNDVDHTRYRNPCGHIALDVGQINAFSEYARDYVQLRVKEFKLIFYQFFITLPQQPKTDEEEQTYYHYIDNFARMGGDIITFNPLVRHLPPRPTQDGFWELAPAGSRAERILNYARGKGFDIGFYMGSAAGNAAYCTSPMVPFAGDDRAIWKKRDRSGACSSENCIACDEFAEWFYQVQHNTIHKYDVTLWSWDPGPGNGLFCYSTQHGHIPGKGAYKGFQNAMKVVSKLKNDFPRLYIQGFHGTKEYGLWGLRGFDQHECYWEQSPYDMATTYLDLSEDRLTASGMRFQSMWNQNFRFLPPEMNHALASRMTQYCLMPEELRFLYDQLGWKYAFFSSLAVGASMTVTMIPECLDEISRGEYEQYYRKWIPWARKYFDYAKHTIPFGAQVVCGAMDGFARIKGNHGFLFMFNPGPLEVDACFTLDETIGLKVEGIYHLTELYPMQQVLRCDESNGKSSFALHDCMHTHLAPYSATLWELRQEKPMEISWCNLPGSLRLEGDAAIIDGCYGEDGTEKCGVLTAGETVKKIVINGVDMPFERKFQCAMVNVAFGIQSLPRSICHWRDTEGKYELSEQAEKFKFS